MDLNEENQTVIYKLVQMEVCTLLSAVLVWACVDYILLCVALWVACLFERCCVNKAILSSFQVLIVEMKYLNFLPHYRLFYCGGGVFLSYC